MGFDVSPETLFSCLDETIKYEDQMKGKDGDISCTCRILGNMIQRKLRKTFYPVFNNDASLPYNHDLSESHIVRKQIRNLARKTAFSSANEGSAYAAHGPTNVASGAGHIIQ
ncbi:hypothetical protein CSKR_106340 [Clonorchis sinensis]|uniref:Uncharacterized protein n=1 Tax=Clonorchis sinensis TaxID=79923 RepID=A0A3R7D3X5_CLOSI|nr:hypothetical protein CSKR_106340 [Clonorchis sinensis]